MTAITLAAIPARAARSAGPLPVPAPGLPLTPKGGTPPLGGLPEPPEGLQDPVFGFLGRARHAQSTKDELQVVEQGAVHAWVVSAAVGHHRTG
jgi:hypothetical protein